jgi:hypothetical protein
MSVVAVAGAVWTLGVGTGLLVVGLLVGRVDRWAREARHRR